MSADEPREPAPFIVGTGRCGTTLLRVMLDAHPMLAIPPETHFIGQVLEASKERGDSRSAFLRAIAQSRNWSNFKTDAAKLSERIHRIQPFDTGEALRVFYGLYAERFDKPRWGDKTPGYLTRMRRIQALLPEAHFIHLVRDGRDVALSVLPLMDRDGERHTVEDGARWWVERLKRGQRESAGIANYLEIRYEDLASEPEPTLRKICEFLVLPWDTAMLRFHEGAAQRLVVDDQSPRDAPGLSKPPNTNQIGRWREEMSPTELARVEEIAGQMLREYGYV